MSRHLDRRIAHPNQRSSAGVVVRDSARLGAGNFRFRQRWGRLYELWDTRNKAEYRAEPVCCGAGWPITTRRDGSKRRGMTAATRDAVD